MTPEQQKSPQASLGKQVSLSVAVASTLAAVTFGGTYASRWIDERVKAGAIDPNVLLPKLHDPKDTAATYHVTVDSTMEPLTVSDLSPDQRIETVQFNAHSLAQEVSDFLNRFPDYTLDTRVATYYDGIYYILAYQYPDRVPTPRHVYVASPQYFPSIDAYNKRLHPDWIERAKGYGRTRSSPRSQIYPVVSELTKTLPSSERVSLSFPGSYQPYLKYPDEAQWVIVTEEQTPPAK